MGRRMVGLPRAREEEGISGGWGAKPMGCKGGWREVSGPSF